MSEMSVDSSYQYQKLRVEVKREIKMELQDYIAPLREAIAMWNKMVPDCDLTRESNPIEISDDDDGVNEHHNEQLNEVHYYEIPNTNAVAPVNISDKFY